MRGSGTLRARQKVGLTVLGNPANRLPRRAADLLRFAFATAVPEDEAGQLYDSGWRDVGDTALTFITRFN